MLNRLSLFRAALGAAATLPALPAVAEAASDATPVTPGMLIDALYDESIKVMWVTGGYGNPLCSALNDTLFSMNKRHRVPLYCCVSGSDQIGGLHHNVTKDKPLVRFPGKRGFREAPSYPVRFAIMTKLGDGATFPSVPLINAALNIVSSYPDGKVIVFSTDNPPVGHNYRHFVL